MAAIAAPLIQTLGPGLIDLIAGLVHQKAPAAEQARGKGTGPVKYADVFAATMQDLINAHAAGQIPTLPDEALVKIVIQAVVTSMKLSGQLSSDPTAVALAASGSQSIILAAGQTLVVTVKQ